MSQLDRGFMTFRLFPEDRVLLQDLGRGPERATSRHEALLELVPIVEQLEMPDIRGRERRPIRLGIPTELDSAIRELAERTGQSFVDVLLAAARAYRERYPYSGDAES